MDAYEPLESAIETLSQKGYCCSQILALLILSAQGKENPDLVRSLGGLCHGIGQSGNVCGIMTGACCVISYLVGTGQDAEMGSGQVEAKIIQEEFIDWFTELSEKRWGSIQCSVIIDEDNPAGPDKSGCRHLLAQTWTCLLGILTRHNVAYAMRHGSDEKPKAA